MAVAIRRVDDRMDGPGGFTPSCNVQVPYRDALESPPNRAGVALTPSSRDGSRIGYLTQSVCQSKLRFRYGDRLRRSRIHNQDTDNSCNNRHCYEQTGNTHHSPLVINASSDGSLVYKGFRFTDKSIFW
jgi:hypothetical protein